MLILYCIIFYVNIYGSYKMSKTVRFFWPIMYNYIVVCQKASWSTTSPSIYFCDARRLCTEQRIYSYSVTLSV